MRIAIVVFKSGILVSPCVVKVKRAVIGCLGFPILQPHTLASYELRRIEVLELYARLMWFPNLGSRTIDNLGSDML